MREGVAIQRLFLSIKCTYLDAQGFLLFFCFLPPTGWYEDSFSHFTCAGCTMHAILQTFEHFSLFSFCIFQSLLLAIRLLLRDIQVFTVEKLPVTSNCGRNDGLLKAKV